ncbi:MAG: proline dehydrogenase family protein, partial [Burkholderiales bacterium]|nr:proline dehydrogenase family protein [Burkholderiales bacterium]
MYNFNCKNNSQLRQIISENYRKNEAQCVENLLNSISITNIQEQNAQELAKKLILKVRNKRIKGRGIDAIMNEFKLSTNEGIALMCLAESLLRIPDKVTQDRLIRDRIAKGDWINYTKTENSFVNAASWGLLITGKLSQSHNSKKLSDMLLNIISKGGEPLIRKAIITAVQFMGSQFVMGETIEKALEAAKEKEPLGYQFSYDMLGEAALTSEDAKRYMQSYIDAIHRVGQANNKRGA